jgi:branched-chain amino acid transport system permease protein
MKIFLQLLINGTIAGGIYALVASGFALIYSTNKFIHFAHGGVITLSAYFLFWLSSVLGLNFYMAIFLTILFSAFLGYLLNRFFFRSFRAKNASASILLVSGIALFILMESIALLFFGADVKTIDFVKTNVGIEISGAIITPLQLVIVVVSIILFFGLYLLMKKTKIGKAMRSVADNKDVAEIMGISTEKIYSWSFVIGSSIAGMAAILISLEQNIEPTMGVNLIVKGFTGAIIGGVASVPGAILGAILLGLIENFGIWFFPSGYKDVITFILLFTFLLFRPEGILEVKSNSIC